MRRRFGLLLWYQVLFWEFKCLLIYLFLLFQFPKMIKLLLQISSSHQKEKKPWFNWDFFPWQTPPSLIPDYEWLILKRICVSSVQHILVWSFKWKLWEPFFSLRFCHTISKDSDLSQKRLSCLDSFFSGRWSEKKKNPQRNFALDQVGLGQTSNKPTLTLMYWSLAHRLHWKLVAHNLGSVKKEFFNV